MHSNFDFKALQNDYLLNSISFNTTISNVVISPNFHVSLFHKNTHFELFCIEILH